jgi:Domain of unknown function (DUF4145)
MQLIPENSVRSSSSSYGSNSIKVPTSISTNCPHCNALVVFALDKYLDDAFRKAASATGICPGCQLEVFFWVILDSKDNQSMIYMYPQVKNYYPHPDFLNDLPEPLSRSFVSAVNALNSQNYTATAVCARRTLEGIFKYLVPEEERKKTLVKLIEHTKLNMDLSAPLTFLSHAIREGGNLGAHFDTEKEPNEVMARQMVDLLEYLISYLYVLPKEIKQLEESLSNGV